MGPRPSPDRLASDAPPDEAEALLALAEEYCVSPAQARARTVCVAGALAGWRDGARRNAIRKREIAMMAESIEHRMNTLIATA